MTLHTIVLIVFFTIVGGYATGSVIDLVRVLRRSTREMHAARAAGK